MGKTNLNPLSTREDDQIKRIRFSMAGSWVVQHRRSGKQQRSSNIIAKNGENLVRC